MSKGILLTTAANDKDLVRMFEEIHPGLSLPFNIQFGDFMWNSANGWDTTSNPAWEFPIKFAGDRKKVPDLLACVDDGRHLQQIRNAYEGGIDRQCLIVEGLIKEDIDGKVKQRKGAHPVETTYKQLMAYLNQIQALMGVQVYYTRSLRETISRIYHLYLMYQEPPEDHTSLKKFYVPPMPSVTMKPSLMRRVAKELTYVSWDRSDVVEKEFNTIEEMASADKARWMTIPGIGETIAHSAVRELQT